MKRYFFYGLLIISGLFYNGNAFAQPKKRPVDILIKNTTLVDVVNKQILKHKTIAIEKGKIIAITDGSLAYASKKVIDGSRMITLPGFVDTHTHLWQHVCKSCYPKESLQVWIKVYDDIHYLTPAQLYKVVLAASGEALLSGITTVSDYASLSFNDYAFEVNVKAMRDAGLNGAIVYNNPSVFVPDSIKLKEIPVLREKYKKQFDIWMGYGPLSFYHIPQVYSGIVIGNQLNMNFSEHTMENNQEQKDFYDTAKQYYARFGLSINSQDKAFLKALTSLGRPSNVDAYQAMVNLKRQILVSDSLLISKKDTIYKPLNAFEKKSMENLFATRLISPLILLDYLKGLNNFLSIHSVWLQNEDIDILKKYNAAISHNPESNLYLSSGIAPVDDYLRNGINVSLGTDGAASNDGIDMFSAMREMWNVYKIKLSNVQMSKNITDWDILQSATINGAKALKIDKKTGSVDVGKNANITMISANELGLSPIRLKTLISLLIYSANTRNVKTVIANGKLEVEDGKLKNLNENTLATDLTEIANAADLAHDKGKIWSENISLTAQNLATYLYRYRSIRKPDSVKISVSNSLTHPVKLSIIASGAVFGGGTPTVVDSVVAARFPDRYTKTAFKDEFLLMPGDSITVIKESSFTPKGVKTFSYKIISSAAKIERLTGSGQLLILAENRYKKFNDDHKK
ncbi:amidohydrolase family protein [Mucilaginibacter paludis]|uniref:Amidohydrolase n=1 Tax=Mucilaginibacter paludis DSM 18603 TaxID=714943 RepID=H1Y458_9SPHI|nr:amidohydrolase family protein [Mucilaginibacter paludis]EHQ24794.1 amidohydrolase [Mucilaginibacter paludis DSM 18603]